MSTYNKDIILYYKVQKPFGTLAYITSYPFWNEIEAEEIILNIDNYHYVPLKQ